MTDANILNQFVTVKTELRNATAAAEDCVSKFMKAAQAMVYWKEVAIVFNGSTAASKRTITADDVPSLESIETAIARWRKATEELVSVERQLDPDQKASLGVT